MEEQQNSEKNMEFNNKKIKGNGSISFIFLPYGAKINLLEAFRLSALPRLRTPPTFSTFSSCSLLRAGAFSLFKLVTLGSSYHCVIIRASRVQVYINKVSLKPMKSRALPELPPRSPAGSLAKSSR